LSEHNQAFKISVCGVLLGAATADARFRYQPSSVVQVPFANQRQRIGLSPEQIGAIGFAQRNDDSPAMPLECQWNGVKEILVGGDKNGLLLLCVSKQLCVLGAGWKKLQGVRGRMACGFEKCYGWPGKIFVEEKSYSAR
jgi:hypothetical protein